MKENTNEKVKEKKVDLEEDFQIILDSFMRNTASYIALISCVAFVSSCSYLFCFWSMFGMGIEIFSYMTFSDVLIRASIIVPIIITLIFSMIFIDSIFHKDFLTIGIPLVIFGAILIYNSLLLYFLLALLPLILISKDIKGRKFKRINLNYIFLSIYLIMSVSFVIAYINAKAIINGFGDHYITIIKTPPLEKNKALRYIDTIGDRTFLYEPTTGNIIIRRIADGEDITLKVDRLIK